MTKFQTIGEILKKERENQNIPLEKVERDTKIQLEQLEWIENNLFRQYDAHIFAKGQIKSYARYLGVDYEKLFAIYRRDFENVDIVRTNLNKKSKKSNKDFLLKKNIINIFSNRNFRFSIIISIILLIIGFGSANIVRLAFRPPSLKISEPIEIESNYNGKLQWANKTISFRILSEEDTILKINNVPVILNQNYEYFTDDIILTENSQNLVIEASNSLGVSSVIELELVQKIPEIKEMNLVIFSKVENQPLKILSDGILTFDAVPNLNERLKLNAQNQFKIQTQFPENFELLINDQRFDLTDGLVFENTGREIIQK